MAAHVHYTCDYCHTDITEQEGYHVYLFARRVDLCDGCYHKNFSINTVVDLFKAAEEREGPCDD